MLTERLDSRRLVTLTILRNNSAVRLLIDPSLSIRESLDATDLRVRAACGGVGTCGACIVKVEKGDVPPPALAEYQKLIPEERAEGSRLACQLRPLGDLTIRMNDPAPPSAWKSIPPEALPAIDRRRPDLGAAPFGLAVDLGTTHIRLAFWDMKAGRRIATRCGPNPQGLFGADVLNRLEAARRHPKKLMEAAREAILDGLRDMLARDVGEVTPMLAEIGRITVVGNAAMLALLTGQGGEALVDPANWLLPVDCQPRDPAWFEAWKTPKAEILLPDPAAGFIGTDLLADLITSGVTDGPPGALLLDVGTNTEIALWDGTALHITSVPGGPAFEGVGVKNGMPAEPGAIYQVRAAGDGFTLETIGGLPARGLCGSGLLGGVAALLAAGILKPSGRFTEPTYATGFALDPGNQRTAITGKDVDAFQQAKAATAAAMEELLARAGLGWGEVTRIVLCGSFGRDLDFTAARAVGLIPNVNPEIVEFWENAALTGCEKALFDTNCNKLFYDFSRLLRPINLSMEEGFESRFINHLRLRPVSPVGR